MRKMRGFTLIELLVVIAIIAILATLVITQLGNARVKANNAAAKSDVTEVGKAVELYKNNDANSGFAIISSVSGGNTLSSTGAGDLDDIFSGSASFTNANGAAFTYGLKLTDTPAATYTYTYLTGNTSAARTLVNAGCYVFSTNGIANETNTTFYVKDGTTGGGAVPTPPAAGGCAN